MDIYRQLRALLLQSERDAASWLHVIVNIAIDQEDATLRDAAIGVLKTLEESTA